MGSVVDEIFGECRAASVATKSAIYVWGYNQSGQTGRTTNNENGQENYLRIPKLFGLQSTWLDVSCGREHTAAVASDGSLFTWGGNEFGHLGDGTERHRKYQKKVKQLLTERVKWVSCGAHCTVAIAEPRENDGTVSTRRLWVWVQNQGSNHPRLYWGAITPDTKVRQVSCGSVHVVNLLEDGLQQAWGYNEYGQLGRGITCKGLQGARVINAYTKFLDEAPELVKITQVSCGEYHMAAIDDNGDVYVFPRTFVRWRLSSMLSLKIVVYPDGTSESDGRAINLAT